MGCCVSKQQDLFIDIPRTVSTTDTWALRQKSLQGGCKLLPFTAACPASYPYQSLTRVVLGDGHLFAALWEGHGGSQAARHCVSNCYELLLQSMQSNPDPCCALRQTTQQLDETYLASPDLPDAVKAGVGATGIMLYINTRTNQCCVARLGDGMPFIAASQGSFNTTVCRCSRSPQAKATGCCCPRPQARGSGSSLTALQHTPMQLAWAMASLGSCSKRGSSSRRVQQR
ncbi:hypothetical protein COO60DRAFT_211417 [Scenedesmus sp. NREL 46B-D3]|nr:hypothetical protein COO60DRAFT_211417 [Scenedesmus sp. NREL 46B-D3]